VDVGAVDVFGNLLCVGTLFSDRESEKAMTTVNVSMGTQDEAPLVIERGGETFILPFDDGVEFLGEIARSANVSIVDLVGQIVQNGSVSIDTGK
jgi:hypothetical protein